MEGRVNIAIVGDGYTAAELPIFAVDAQGMLDRLLVEEPFASYPNQINAWRIDAVSVESGPGETGTARNTALKGFLNCAGIARLYCVDTAAGDAILRAAIPGVVFNIKIAIGNTTTYGGSGGNWSTTTRNSNAREVVVHEVGHSFASLDDEYVDAQICPTNGAGANSDINSTRQTTLASIPWSLWIASGTPIPTVTTTPSVPGLYEGAHYCATGQFRPTFDSLMRSLLRPFDAVNEEQVAKRIRTLARPIASFGPKSTSLTVYSGQLERFTVVASAAALPATSELPVVWRLNGTTVGTGLSFVLDPASLPAGANTLTASASDPSVKVRKDPTGLMARTITWALNKSTSSAPAAKILTAVLPSARATASGGTVTAFSTLLNTSAVEATACQLALSSSVGISSFIWRETDATNTPIGLNNPTFNVPAQGSKTFVVALTTSGTFAARDFAVVGRCSNALDSPISTGVNALKVTSSAAAPPDVISIVATTGQPAGTVTLPSDGSPAAFAVAAVNIGTAAAAIRVQPSAGGDALPVAATVCETNPSTGACLAPASTHVVVSFATNEIRTFTVFAAGSGTIPFDPAAYRFHVGFLRDNAIGAPDQFGSTTTAAKTAGQ